MKLYRQYLFPRLLDRAMRRRVLAAPRGRLLANARGDTLEIGFGTGANLAHYPCNVDELHIVDPEPMLPDRVARRIEESGIQVSRHQLQAERLPFADASFDTAVCTFTLCSVSDPHSVLQEMLRVLKPSGQLLLLEHGLNADPSVQRWQRRLNGLNACLGEGCQLTRDTSALVQAAGFTFADLRQYELPRTPRIAAYTTEAIALPAHSINLRT